MSDTLGELVDAIQNRDEAAVARLLAAEPAGADPGRASDERKRPVDLAPAGNETLRALLA